MAKKYHMWGKSECPYCIQAQAELTHRKLTHTFYILDDDAATLEEVKKEHSWLTVPLITCEDTDGTITFIGGYTDLQEKLKTEET